MKGANAVVKKSAVYDLSIMVLLKILHCVLESSGFLTYCKWQLEQMYKLSEKIEMLCEAL